MSIGFFEHISNVSFWENTYYCGAGQYGYTVKSEVRQTGASGAREIGECGSKKEDRRGTYMYI